MCERECVCVCLGVCGLRVHRRGTRAGARFEVEAALRHCLSLPVSLSLCLSVSLSLSLSLSLDRALSLSLSLSLYIYISGLGVDRRGTRAGARFEVEAALRHLRERGCVRVAPVVVFMGYPLLGYSSSPVGCVEPEAGPSARLDALGRAQAPVLASMDDLPGYSKLIYRVIPNVGFMGSNQVKALKPESQRRHSRAQAPVPAFRDSDLRGSKHRLRGSRHLVGTV